MQYNCEKYLTELKGRLQSAHEIARQKLVSSKEEIEECYDKDAEAFDVKLGQKVLLFELTVHRGRSKKL